MPMKLSHTDIQHQLTCLDGWKLEDGKLFKEVVLSDFEEAGDHDVFKKIRNSFDDKKVAATDLEIRSAMDELLKEAIAQIKASG